MCLVPAAAVTQKPFSCLDHNICLWRRGETLREWAIVLCLWVKATAPTKDDRKTTTAVFLEEIVVMLCVSDHKETCHAAH